MCRDIIINDLTEEEEAVLYSRFPQEQYDYIKVADMVRSNWQPFCASRVYAIAKSNDAINILEAHDIAVLGYESTTSEFLNCGYIVQDLEAIELRDLEMAYVRFHNLPLTILETPRCIVREHTLQDYDDIVELYDDESVTEYMEPLFEPEEEREYQRQYIERIYKFYGYGLWVIVDKNTGHIIGRAGVETKNNRMDYEEVELSYQVKKEYQNKGIATEVCNSIVEYTFTTLDKCKIVARVDDRNAPSIRLLGHLGFVKEESGIYVLTR